MDQSGEALLQVLQQMDAGHADGQAPARGGPRVRRMHRRPATRPAFLTVLHDRATAGQLTQLLVVGGLVFLLWDCVFCVVVLCGRWGCACAVSGGRHQEAVREFMREKRQKKADEERHQRELSAAMRDINRVRSGFRLRSGG